MIPLIEREIGQLEPILFDREIKIDKSLIDKFKIIKSDPEGYKKVTIPDLKISQLFEIFGHLGISALKSGDDDLYLSEYNIVCLGEFHGDKDCHELNTFMINIMRSMARRSIKVFFEVHKHKTKCIEKVASTQTIIKSLAKDIIKEGWDSRCPYCDDDHYEDSLNSLLSLVQNFLALTRQNLKNDKKFKQKKSSRDIRNSLPEIYAKAKKLFDLYNHQIESQKKSELEESEMLVLKQLALEEGDLLTMTHALLKYLLNGFYESTGYYSSRQKHLINKIEKLHKKNEMGIFVAGYAHFINTINNKIENQFAKMIQKTKIKPLILYHPNCQLWNQNEFLISKTHPIDLNNPKKASYYSKALAAFHRLEKAIVALNRYLSPKKKKRLRRASI